MLTNNRSKPKLKSSFKLKQFLNIIGLPGFQKDQKFRNNSIDNHQFELYQKISNSIRKNSFSIQPQLLPSITNRKSLIVEPISYQINTLDHLIQYKRKQNKKKELNKNQKQSNSLSIAMYSNDQMNLSNEEVQVIQSIKNSPQKQQSTNKSSEQKKTRKQKLIEFLKGQHQNIQFTTTLQKKSQQDQILFPSFIITKYQELQF